MIWKSPNLLWVEILPLLVLAGRVLAEYGRSRRVRLFGEPALMGVSASRRAVSVSILFSVAGMAAITAILPLPVRRTEPEVQPSTLVEIQLDPSLFATGPREPGFSLNEVNEVVRGIVHLAGPSHFALARSDAPSTPLVPATTDGEGLAMILERILAESRLNPAERPSPGEDGAEASRSARTDWALRRIVITADARITGPDTPSSKGPGSESLVLRLYSAATASEVTQTETGRGWAWTYRFDLLERFLAGATRPKEESRSPGAEEDYIVLLAGAGLFALLLEGIWARYLAVGERRVS